MTTDPERVLKTHIQWYALLEEMVSEYREKFPDDCQTDLALATAILDKLVSVGVVKLNAEGEYILPGLLLH